MSRSKEIGGLLCVIPDQPGLATEPYPICVTNIDGAVWALITLRTFLTLTDSQDQLDDFWEVWELVQHAN